jgi:hypothetical protein
MPRRRKTGFFNMHIGTGPSYLTPPRRRKLTGRTPKFLRPPRRRRRSFLAALFSPPKRRR